MKNFSSNKAQKGKTAFRTPSPFKAMQSEFNKRNNSSQSMRRSGTRHK